MRKKRIKQKPKKPQKSPSLPSVSWIEEDGFHYVTPGLPPSPEQLERITKEYQKRIRNSPLWDKMVRDFGEEKAEELLKQFRAKLGN